MGLLDGKIVVVTGGARGQGRAHAVASARAGADVAVIDAVTQLETVRYPMATPADLDATVRDVEKLGRRAIGLKADARDQEALDVAVATVIGELGPIDALIVNHGIWVAGPELWNMDEKHWTEMLDVNLTGIWKAAKAVVPHMIERGVGGSIVVTASVAGLEPAPTMGHYSTSKHGAIGLTKNLALELAPYGIRCNCLAPGVIETPMLVNREGMDKFKGGPDGTVEDIRAAGARYHALKGTRALPAETVADAALWLNSELASMVTGVTVPVDAGHMLLAGFNHAPVG